MLLIFAVLLLLIFAGAGFAAHVLWWGLILAVAVGIAGMVSGR